MNIQDTTIKFIDGPKLMSFKDFCLSESVLPKEVQYGANFPDFNDKKTYVPSKGMTSCWFVHGTALYWIWIEDKTGDVSFMKCSTPFLKDNEHIIKQIYLDYKEYVMGNQKGSYNAINIFSEIFYVVIKLAEMNNNNTIGFMGYDTALDNFYKLLVKNKALLNKLRTLGWTYRGVIRGDHIFERK